MTLTQLEAFVLVARLGSVRAAAKVLGVSEPAVSGALGVLRQHLGDPLLHRTNGAMELTEGGKRLVTIASQMVNLAVEAETAIRDAQGAPELLRVVAAGTVAEFVAPGLLAAFTERTRAIEATVGLTGEAEMPALLFERLADVGLGPRLAGLTSEPFMRYRLVVVASPAHRLARMKPVPPGVLGGQDWLVGPAGADRSSDSGRLLAALRVPESRLRVFGSEAAAWVAAAEGHGIAPAVHHLVAPELTRGALVPLAVGGTPVDLFWYVSTLSPDRRRRRPLACGASWRRPTPCTCCPGPTAASPLRGSAPPSTSRSGADPGRAHFSFLQLMAAGSSGRRGEMGRGGSRPPHGGS